MHTLRHITALAPGSTPLGARRPVLEREIRDRATVIVPARRLDADGLKAWQRVLGHG